MRHSLLPAAFVATLFFTLAWSPAPAVAASAAELNRTGSAALNRLYAGNPRAKELSGRATAVLVFPKMTKAGFAMVGGQFGEGVLYRGGKVAGYYSTAGASYGMQAGAQTFGYALFFMSPESLAYLESSQGFEVGVGPSVVVADETFNKSASTTTIQNAIYAFIFNQKGAMAGLGIQGNKITRIDK